MHSQRGKGIFHNSKNIYRNILKKTKIIDAHCRSVVHTIVDDIKYK